MTALYLESRHLDIVKDILKKHLFKCKVFAFGSRVTGKHKPHSDLDLCIVGDTPLSFQKIAALKEGFSESSLPIRIDIVDWTSISPAFQKIIQTNQIEIKF